MSRSILHRVRLVLIACIAVLALPAASLAAPPTFHNNLDFVEEDIDVCGVLLDVHVTGVENVWLDSDAVKVTSQVTQVFTTDDGRTVVLRAAGTFNGIYTDNGDGTATIVEDYRGLPESISSGRGGPVLRDAGLIIITTVIDIATDQPLSVDMDIRGPHPEAEADFAIFCDAFLEALG